MAPIDLSLVRSFVAVHETGSFSGAAVRLGVPRSTVSRAVASLEESLGVRLFHRTTRKVSTSSAGEGLYARVAGSLSSLDAALDELVEREEEPAGKLRVTATVDLGVMVIAEAAARFVARYPKVEVEVHLGSDVIDLVKEGIDIALRVTQKPPADSELSARRVGSFDLRLFAAPAYLARKGTPKQLADLAHHDFVGLARTRAMLPKSARLGGHRVVSDDMFFLREAVRHGAGIGLLASFMAEEDVTRGVLVGVMNSYFYRTGIVSIVVPSRKNLPRKVTAFRDLLSEMLRSKPLSAKP